MHIKYGFLILFHIHTTQYTICTTSINCTSRIEFSILMSAIYLIYTYLSLTCKKKK